LWPLAPVIPVLEPRIFALGYTIESGRETRRYMPGTLGTSGIRPVEA
jgi:hypothetical protein